MTGPNLFETSLLAQRDAALERIASYRKQIEALPDKTGARATALRKLILVHADVLDLLLKYLTDLDHERRVTAAVWPAPEPPAAYVRHEDRIRRMRVINTEKSRQQTVST